MTRIELEARLNQLLTLIDRALEEAAEIRLLIAQEEWNDTYGATDRERD